MSEPTTTAPDCECGLPFMFTATLVCRNCRTPRKLCVDPCDCGAIGDFAWINIEPMETLSV